MKKVIQVVFALVFTNIIYAQDVSVRVAQTSFTDVDPDGGGPALGSVVIRFELQYSAGTVLADGLGLSMVYQSSRLMATPTNTTVKQGPLAAAPTTWVQGVDNRAGNPVSVTYGGQSFDRRMIVTFNEPSGTPNVGVNGTFTSWVEITYYTLGAGLPQGGFITPEPGSIVPQNELSSDGGLTTFPYLSPNLNIPVALGGTVPVSFTKSSVTCSPSGASIVWGTASESNTNYYEVLKSTDGGNTWAAIDRKTAAGNSATDRNYQSLDLEAGAALYKIRQVDKDGRSTETAVMRSACEAKNAITSILYPVPANNNMTLAITANKMIKTTLQIVDAKGRLMQTREVTITKGNNNIPFNVSRLAAGEYMLISSNPELTLNKKFIVAR